MSSTPRSLLKNARRRAWPRATRLAIHWLPVLGQGDALPAWQAHSVFQQAPGASVRVPATSAQPDLPSYGVQKPARFAHRREAWRPNPRTSLLRWLAPAHGATVAWIACTLGLWLSAISQTAHAQSGTLFGYPAATVNAFDQAYWNSQPAPVRALENMSVAIDGPGVTASSDRYGIALALAKQGYAIDVPIMVWGWDPYATMTLRAQYGYTWVPSALQAPVYVPPGVSVPGQASYNPAAPPPGSIRVDNVAADYAPASDCSSIPACVGLPPAPAPAPTTIGPDLGFQATVIFGTPSQTVSLEVYSSNSTEHFAEGLVYTNPAGASYLYHVLGTELMSPSQRIAIWIGPVPEGAAAPFTIVIQ